VRAGLSGVPDAAIVGIHSGGAWLAERLAADLGLTARLGFIDVSFYRDDYAKKGLHPDVKPTHIDFNVDGATILLVDDVLYTGRTTRAAINVLFDYGRPAASCWPRWPTAAGASCRWRADFVGAHATLGAGPVAVAERATRRPTLAHDRRRQCITRN
jgi:pyrimidine operon attenuation protein/uracil phosphoribosyltransferase